MKTGVLFWGFKDLNLAADCVKRIKKNHSIRDIYIQISMQEKTISLLDIFPEEIIRCEYDDLNSLNQWLHRNDKKNIIVVIDFWLFLLSKNFPEKVNSFKNILKQPFQFLIYIPKFYHESIVKNESKKLNMVVEKTNDLFVKVRLFYELALNSPSSITLFSSSPCISFLNMLCGQDFFMTKEISFLTFVPSLLKNFPSTFLSEKRFLEELTSKICEINDGVQLYKNKDYISNFRSIVSSDTLNVHYKDYSGINKKKARNFFVTSSIDRFYKTKTKEEYKVLLWSIYLGILEYKQNFVVIPKEETSDHDEMIFSRISV